MTLEPLFDQLLVKVQEDKKTVGDMVLPDSVNPDRPQRGTVMAKGNQATTVQVGEEVVFRKYAPDQVEIDGEKFWLLAEKDVIAIVRT